MTLPRFIVLKAPDAENYLCYRPRNGTYRGYAEFTETMVVSANAKFEVEFAKNGLVHIRSCTTNKYLKRIHKPSITGSPNEEYWITITADKPEEDRSKESCTLFKPIDTLHGNYRFVHVQSGHYLCLWPLATSDLRRGVLANHTHVADNQNAIFKVIDWESLVILPRFVAFKGNNNMFLGLTEAGERPLKFSCGDIGDHHVTMEVFYMNNGDIRFKQLYFDKFWRSSQNRILVDYEAKGNDNNRNTHFRAFKVDGKTIALRNVGNDKFCNFKGVVSKETTGDLAATVPSITKETFLCVLEPVLSRTIYNLRYDTENARVYNEKVLVVAQNSATNCTTQANTLDVKLSYTETNTSIWLAHFTLGLETEATFQVGVPFIGEGGTVEISPKYETGIEWGKTKTMTTDMTDTHQVRVPPMTKVTVYLKMTNGTCDVPFMFTQKDALYNGTFVTTDVLGNSFTGTNYYNIQYDIKEEPLTSEPPTSERPTSEPPTSGNQNITLYFSK